MNKLPERIAQAALHHYFHHPALASSRGKPKEDSEWTVYSALVAQEHVNDDLWVVSCATGTKVTGLCHRRGGCVLHDSHAEVLVRRGLLHALWNEIIVHEKEALSNPLPLKGRRLLERVSGDANLGFRLRQGLSLHLYISDSPCGDASIYELATAVDASAGEGSCVAPNTITPTTTQFTGSKLVVSPGTGLGWDGLQPLSRSAATSSSSRNVPLAREPDQQLRGRLRSKSAHSNVTHLTSSMSCSDKLVRWQALGWQGSLLSSCIVEWIGVTSVVVSRDPRQVNQEEALHRALVQRFEELRHVLKDELSKENFQKFWKPVFDTPFYVSTVEVTFACGKSLMSSKVSQFLAPSKKRRRDDGDLVGHGTSSETASRAKISPCGFAINWNCSREDSDKEGTEVLVGARGTRQGKKPSADKEFMVLQSRLSRSSLVELARRVGLDASDGTLYHSFKQRHARPGYEDVKNLVLRQRGPLTGWLMTTSESDYSLTGFRLALLND